MERTKRSRFGQIGSSGSKRSCRCQSAYATGAIAIGVPGCPEFACCTASIASVRIVFTQSVSSEVSVMFLPSRARPVGDERRGERRPARLMGCAESLAGVGVEVFVEEQLVAPRGIPLEERGRPPDGSAAASVAEEQAEEAALEVIRHRPEMCE